MAVAQYRDAVTADKGVVMSDFKSARRVDELGRVVIPKEIRRACRMRGGDLVKIYIKEETVCIEKYSPVKDITTFADDFVTALSKATGKEVMVTDTNEVITLSKSKKEYAGKQLVASFSELIKGGKSVICNKVDGADTVAVFDGQEEFFGEFIIPFSADGDVIGSVVVFTTEKGESIERADVVASTFGAKFLEKQFDVKNEK